ncbi:hypothetical protein BgAZ_501610 [Babesia gibsoni]|uniref:GOLD domain-containing protein n=1 Tax=Babesia gibsoni TaxID=33632 RepID=A0AAD8PCT7_BABGI|nr:hypothetical protein BgAZ_501610 [Babesia gibsoni]
MLTRAVPLITVALIAAVSVQGTHIQMEESELRCFTVVANRGDFLTGSTETIPASAVISSSVYQVATLVDIPRRNPIFVVKNNQFQHRVIETGYYALCVQNATTDPLTLIFTFRVESGLQKDLSNISTVEDANDVLKFAKKLLENTHVIVDRTEAYSTREKLYSKIIEDMNSRIVWWSTCQMIFLIVICFFQIYYISSFFEVKSLV